MSLFKCKHPFSMLHVAKDQTIEDLDDDFYHITLHLYCVNCGKDLDRTYAKMKGGAKGFLSRGRNKSKINKGVGGSNE